MNSTIVQIFETQEQGAEFEVLALRITECCLLRCHAR